MSHQGLTLHYHHLKILFWNPSPQYQTMAEKSLNFELPPQIDANLVDVLDSEAELYPYEEYNELLVPVWSKRKSDGDEIEEDNIPVDAEILPSNVFPPIDS